jgi:adenylate kinase family enzyme
MSTPSPLLIGIAGAKQSGKTTLAKLLAEKYTLNHTSFAAPIRSFVAELVGGDLAQLEEHKETPLAWLDGKTPRQMMQTLGTEWGRQMVNGELWVRVAMRNCGARAIFSDVRFANEARAIRFAGGCVIRLDRGAAHEDTHESEIPLPDELVDCEQLNDSTPEEMLRRAVGFIGEWSTGQFITWGSC